MSRDADNYPQFPLYIVSKGRSQYMVTSKHLTKMGVDHFIVVEPLQAAEYKAAVITMGLSATVIEMDMAFKESYELCDDLGLSKSTGPGPARNFAWDHSIKNGHSWHWVMDDNIDGFYRFNKNEVVRAFSPAFWRAMEDFCLRYKNIGMAGPNYCMFVPRKYVVPPFVCNTRIYSCNLIRNDLPMRWRGRYNEDTILSIDMLKKKWATIQFNAFLQKKMETQKLKGGNTEEFYHAEGKKIKGQKYTDTGTLAKSKMLVNVHPDVSKVVYRFSRIHHHVDYSRFKKIALIKKDSIHIEDGVNNYGMELVDRGKDK